MKVDRLYNVLFEPHITEKTTNIGNASNQYGFKVAKDATKAEIKEAVETLFKVEVVNVATLNVKGKVKLRMNRQRSRAKSWKKAYVRLAAGNDIEFREIE